MVQHCFVFCENLEAEKAYEVEQHMGSMGVRLEEQKIAALLKVSSETGRGERVYEYLQKLRNSVRCVSEEMVKVIEDWFCGEKATRVKGLVSVDIDDAETEKFAESIAGLAMEREVKANFSEFQDWLEQDADDYEVIVDGANIGLYLQNFAEGGFSIPLVVQLKFRESEKGSWHAPILINNDESSQTWLCITRPSVVESCYKAKALENMETSEDGHGLCWNNETLNLFNT
ncbi:hypothetical protein Q3G72_011838 [Acer saccharum]|nr:hypothetical protein Q3G72_011838 [Acer saccharum]